MIKSAKYRLEENGDFVIENYNQAKPFSSFFPGIAGAWGVPIWAFYVNRGQAIASFGIKNKDCPLMEFQPANKSYYLTPVIGFRTFIKLASNNKYRFYDAFQDGVSSSGLDIENRMVINSYEVKLNEINRTMGIETGIEYFTIPNDNYGALARILTIKNTGPNEKTLEIIDGLPQIIPYGLTNMFLKKLSRTVEAWMGVENLENKVPYLRLKVDPTDRPEVMHVKEGNFYLAFDGRGLIRPIVDPEAIFATTGNFTYPANFLNAKIFSYPKSQLTRSKTPCCMSYSKITLKPGKSYTLYSVMGNMESLDKLKASSTRIAEAGYLRKKQAQNRELILGLQSDVFTRSASKSFDFYCAQNFLDNVMRGGYPLSVEHASGKTHIQAFSRKHGDLERDYNKFLIEPTYFSQGNGNYRDVNQNRRSDIWFNPQLREDNIFTFFNLIQTDGYNPLVIRPEPFSFNQDFNSISAFFRGADMEKVKSFLRQAFTPGELFFFLEQNNISLTGKKRELLEVILDNSTKSAQAEHGEGFWTDHWHYCLDLLESYLLLYPERLRWLLLEKDEFTFFDNEYTVKPRSKKFILQNGRIYQLRSVAEDHHKKTLIRKRKKFPNYLRTQGGHGNIYKTTLITKMLVIIANKFASLDPAGVGVEMEADKPNWYDSLNGLPALLGSSTCETFELKRWIIFLKDKAEEVGLSKEYKIEVPDELDGLLRGLGAACKDRLSGYNFWDKTHTLKEKYRQSTSLGFSGVNKAVKVKDVICIFDCFLKKLEEGLRKAYDEKSKLYYSYFINEVVNYKIIEKTDHACFVKALKFKQRPLPLFLEGVVHALRVTDNKEQAKVYYNNVRKSPLFDKKLKMYKVTAPLKDMPEEIGRARVFVPGWLENESVWLHMEYKYILELLKKGLYGQFFDDFKNVLVPFQDAERYGRSILENSSFIVSSAFPQSDLHGNGFVARLSGSTAEFINIWLIMCAGHAPFYLDKGKKLCAKLRPILPSWLFSKTSEGGMQKNSFAFKFLGKTLVVYHNPKRKDTFAYDAQGAKEIRLKYFAKPGIILKSDYIPAPYSYDLRDGKIERIDIVLS